MKTPSLDVQALLRNPAVFANLSAEAKSWVENGTAFGRVKIYEFCKVVTGQSGIIKLSDETASKTIGITNIEKSKFDTDAFLLGVALEVAFSSGAIADVKAADFSNLLRNPATIKNDSDDATAQSIFNLRGANSLRVDNAIRNGELRYAVGGNELFRVRPDELFVDSSENQLGIKGDFNQVYSLLNSPRIIKMDKSVEPVLETAGAIVLNNAIRIKHYVMEVFQI